MRRHDLTAQHLAILSLAGRHQGDGMPRFTRGRDQCQRLRTWQVPRQDTEFGIRTIQAKRTVTAMNRHVLQLYRPAFGHSGTAQRPIQPPIAGQQLAAHENFPYNIIYERRMDSVPAEITGADKPVVQFCDPSVKTQSDSAAADPHLPYFFSMPARRPVEKAICRLYPPVLASRSSTSPAK